MKKLFAALISAVLILSAFTSCGRNDNNASSGGVASNVMSTVDEVVSDATNAVDDTVDGIVGNTNGTDDSADGMVGDNTASKTSSDTSSK